MDLLRLVAGELRAEIVPEVGGSLAGFWTEGGGHRRTHWVRPADRQCIELRHPLGMSSFPLVPFCNRLRNGLARFEGREIRFPSNHPGNNSPHPLHGIGWQRPWTVDHASRHAIDLSLQVEASPAWPWRFLAQQRYELDERALKVTVSVTNQDDAAMPAGIGHHPYFPHPPGTRLSANLAAMWRSDEELLPTVLETGEVVDRLRTGAVLGELVLDNNFVGWDHAARIDWPADDNGPVRSLLMRSDPLLAYFVVYSPAHADYFCAEPVSQCTDWLNLLPRYGRGPVGGSRVAPDERLAASFTLLPSLT
ncbi:aldose 1-epimerase [Ramlibacter rhizophilus]|uniref:Aldose 1-epimerase n=1 Tax=Ramlibacter rhizophilus TaxID=1781167 RepID=A0A4Z0BS20_9BURK|nr:aldose 1-epimerase [Ramlibacter rhizophilus]TFZ01631.1 aldose 1-epimerase [Ramlibacter rhizophilus]